MVRSAAFQPAGLQFSNCPQPLFRIVANLLIGECVYYGFAPQADLPAAEISHPRKISAGAKQQF